MASGDIVGLQQRAIWQLAAGGSINEIVAAMNRLSDDYQATQSQDEWGTYLKLLTGQSTSLNKVFPHEVYTTALARIINYNYGAAAISAEYAPPASPVVTGTTITCAAGDAVIKLYSWNYTNFVESAITGTTAENVVTFTAIPAGVYVLAYDHVTESERFPTLFLTVS